MYLTVLDQMQLEEAAEAVHMGNASPNDLRPTSRLLQILRLTTFYVRVARPPDHHVSEEDLRPIAARIRAILEEWNSL